MKVLIAETDLFQEMGGGQTVYRRLIAAHPEIEFYYLGCRSGPTPLGRPTRTWSGTSIPTG